MNNSAIFSGLRLVFVDDHAEFRMMRSEMLAMMSYRLQGFFHAQDAQELLRQGQFDVLLSDVSWPGMCGPELAKRAIEAQAALRGS